MCEVTRLNFEEKYPQVIDDLHSASFIAVDCEFSGLFDDQNILTLFDTPKERFTKLQNALKNYTIIQMGLSMFEYDRMKNSFNASTYNFYLMPSSLFKPTSKIVYQLDNLDFLCKAKFDFNKLFYEGINYLNKSEEAEVVKMIEQESFVSNLDKFELQKYFSQVSEWMGRTEKEDMVFDLDEKREVFVYVLHQEIRKRFSNVWTYCNRKGKIVIKRVSRCERLALQENKDENDKFKKKIFESFLGFSRVLKELESLKKPIIGHNILIDLIMIYKTFYNFSSISYKQFKENLHKIYPSVFDTKTLSFNLAKIIPRESCWSSNCLSELHSYLESRQVSTFVIFSPLIYHRVESFANSEKYHDAGFDSYCTGFCFVRMAHIFSCWDPEQRKFCASAIPVTMTSFFGAVANFKNHLNFPKAQVTHIVLDGADPKSVRPALLFVQSTTNIPIDVSKISELIAKYGSVDIQFLNRFQALVAVWNRKQRAEILQIFKNHKQFQMSSYNFLKHSNIGKAICTSTLFASVLLLVFFWRKYSTIYLLKGK